MQNNNKEKELKKDKYKNKVKATKNKVKEKLLKIKNKEILRWKNKKLHEEIMKFNEIKTPLKTFSRLISFFKYEKLMFFLGLILSVVGTVLGILSNLFLKPLIDEITAGNFDNFTKNILSFIIFAFLALIISFISSSMLAVMAQKIVARMRKDLFEHMETLSIKYFDKNQSGDIISVYTNDIELLSTALDQSIVKILIAVLQIIIITIILFYLNWILALVMLALLLIYTILTTIFGIKTEKYSKMKQNRLGKLNAYSEELITSLQTIKIFNYEEKSKERFNEKTDELEDSSINTHFYGTVSHGFSRFLASALYGIIGIIGGYLHIKGLITLGMIVVYIQFVMNLAQPIEVIANQFSTLMTALAGAERIFKILDTESEIDEGYITFEIKDNIKYWNNNGKLIPAHGFVEFKNVNFSYNGEDLALEDISLWAKPCQKIAFVGATGAGKTTITNLINRFYEIQSGEILIDGINIKDIKKRDLRENITTVLQDTNLFTGTIMENIKYGNIDATDEEAIEAAKLSNAHHFIEELPDKYDTIINPDDMSLSQGEAQLLSIARATISSPLILMLDEATSSIDTRTEKLVHNGLDNLMRQYTTLVIAHRLSTVKNSNAIIVIDLGKIIERGDHDDLLLQKGKYFNLYTGKEALI